MTFRSAPKPGSREAIAAGCTCPVLDNHYGKGFPWPDANNHSRDCLSYWITEGCPLHSHPDDIANAEEFARHIE